MKYSVLNSFTINTLKYGRKYNFNSKELNSNESNCGCRNPVEKDECCCKSNKSPVISFNSDNLFSSKLIPIHPSYSQGYLILNKAVSPNVDFWDVTIFEKIISHNRRNDNKINVLQQTRIENGKNYLKIPKSYFTNKGSFYLTVKGEQLAGNILIEDTILVSNPISQPSFCYECSSYDYIGKWTCIGYLPAMGGYAWDLLSYGKPDENLYYLTLQSASVYSENSQTPLAYFNFMSSSEFNNLWGIPGINSDTEGINWVSLINDPANPFRYPDGNQITSNIVYGVIRDLGPWKNLPYYTTNPINGTPYITRSQAIEKFNENLYYSDGINSLGNIDRIEEWVNLQNQAIILFNNQNPTLNPKPLINIPPLACLESASGEIDFDLDFNISADCLTQNPFPFNGSSSTSLAQFAAQFTSWLSSLTSCYCENNQLGGFGCKPNENEKFNGLTSIKVKDLNSLTNETHTINVDILNSSINRGLDLNESFAKAGGISFKNSLYLFGLGFSNNTYQPFIGEIG